MTRFASLCALVCLLAASAAGPVDAADSFFPYPVHTETLANGLKVIVVPMSSGGVIAYWTIVRTGARDEVETGRTGFAHFFEHMMFRGTERFPAEVYNSKMTEIGADSNASTWDDRTQYTLGVAAEDLETVMDLESDRFVNLSYAEDAFRTEAGAVYGEYRKNRTNPFAVLQEALRREAFRVHTYNHTAMGFEEDIQKMPELYEYSKSFFDRFYRPENSTVLVVGEVDPQEVFRLARKYYGAWEPGYQQPEVPTEPEQTEERRFEVSYDGRSLPILWIGYKMGAFDPQDRDVLAAYLLSEVVFGSSSNLYKKLVLDQQSVDFIAPSFSFQRDPGLLEVIARVKDPEKVDQVLAEIDAEIDRYRTSQPDPQRLADIKSNARYGFLMSLDTPTSVASNLASWISLTGGVEVVDEAFTNLGSITPQQVQTTAETLFDPRRRTVGILKGAN